MCWVPARLRDENVNIGGGKSAQILCCGMSWGFPTAIFERAHTMRMCRGVHYWRWCGQKAWAKLPRIFFWPNSPPYSGDKAPRLLPGSAIYSAECQSRSPTGHPSLFALGPALICVVVLSVPSNAVYPVLDFTATRITIAHLDELFDKIHVYFN